MSSRLSVWRVAAALAGLALPGVLLWSACSIPERESSPDKISPCVEGCPIDASVDGQADASQTGPDGGVDASARSVNCGDPSSCNPDTDDSIWSCKGSVIQQSSPAGSIKVPKGSIPSLDPPGTPAPSAPSEPGNKVRRVLSCQVVRGKASEAAASCVHAGQAQEGEACRGVYADADGTMLADCAPGLACVRGASSSNDGTAGQCRPYCCSGLSACGSGSWCAQRRLFESSSAEDPLFVPICTPADNCALLEPGACAAGLACVLVANRATNCDVPGPGVSGQACPCAEGFACSRDTNTCRAICRIGSDDTCPQGGVCVGGGDVMPSGFGLCVGP